MSAAPMAQGSIKYVGKGMVSPPGLEPGTY